MPEESNGLEDGIRYARAGALDRALEIFHEISASDAPPALRSEALRHEADVHRTRSDWEPALAAARQAASVADAADLREPYAEALNAEAIVHLTRGDFASASPMLDRILSLSKDSRVRGLAYQNRGYIAASEGRLEDADRCFARSVRCFVRAGYERGVAIGLINRSQTLLDRGDPQAAALMSQDAIAAAQQIGDLEHVANATINHAEAIARLGDTDAAADHASAALGHFVRSGNRVKQVECLLRLGELHTLAGDRDVAERCFRQGLDIAREIDAPLEVERLKARLAEL